jgi:hypothetical protein
MGNGVRQNGTRHGGKQNTIIFLSSSENYDNVKRIAYTTVFLNGGKSFAHLIN